MSNPSTRFQPSRPQAFDYLPSGEIIDLEHPEKSIIQPGDLRRLMHNKRRYGGLFSHECVTVWEHTVTVTAMVIGEVIHRRMTHDMIFAAAVHDMAEAFLGEMTTAMKNLMPQYRELEQKWQDYLYASVGLPSPLTGTAFASIDCGAAVVYEMKQVLRDNSSNKPAKIIHEHVLQNWDDEQVMHTLLESGKLHRDSARHFVSLATEIMFTH